MKFITLGSSDLIKRKLTEAPKREKPLSLTERLKKEFGFEDSEDDGGKEGEKLLKCVCVNLLCCSLHARLHFTSAEKYLYTNRQKIDLIKVMCLKAVNNLLKILFKNQYSISKMTRKYVL